MVILIKNGVHDYLDDEQIIFLWLLKLLNAYLCAREHVFVMISPVLILLRKGAFSFESHFQFLHVSAKPLLMLGVKSRQRSLELLSAPLEPWSLQPHTNTPMQKHNSTDTLSRIIMSKHQATRATVTPCGHYLTLLGNIHTHKYGYTVAFTRTHLFTDASCHAFTENLAFPSFSWTKTLTYMEQKELALLHTYI